MDTVEKYSSPSSAHTGNGLEKGTDATPLKPRDGGVAIPKTEVVKEHPYGALNDSNPIDLQKVAKEAFSGKSQETPQIRTFSDSVWYVANVKTKREEVTAEIIESFGNDFRVKVWLPKQAELKRINGETEISYRLQIHNYLFFHLSKTDERDLGVKHRVFTAIRSISHVTDILVDPATKEPAIIPNRQIEAFRKMLSDSEHPVRIVRSMVAVGMKMRVRKGKSPLAGLEGIVEDISEEKSKIYLSLDHLGCAVISIDSNLLIPVDDAPSERDRAKGQQTIKDKVTKEDWLALHPYTEALSIDNLYIDFANSMVEALAKSNVGIPPTKRKSFALSLALYVEDKKGHFGLFDLFVRMRIDGHVHPLQAIADGTEKEIKPYMADYGEAKVNLIDLMYFVRANDNGRQRRLGAICEKAKAVLSLMERLDYTRIPSNATYKRHVFYMTQTESLNDLRRFMAWIAHSVKNYSCGTYTPPDQRHIFDNAPQSPNSVALSFALQLSLRLKMKTAVSQLLESIIKATAEDYEVVGCYRKAIHMLAPDGDTRIVYLDEMSGSAYSEGERYTCRIVQVVNNEWRMLEPPKRQRNYSP